MVKRASIKFVPAKQPITELTTKFGGQPVWLSEPQWPVSKSTGRPMQFIAQIALDQELFKVAAGQMAYLFMIGDEEEYVDNTWDAHGGENAVIIQPGQPSVPTFAIDQGPTLYTRIEKPFQKLFPPKPVEFAVKLTYSEDPDFVEEGERFNWDDRRQESYFKALQGNKLGGTPGFMQADEFPSKANWQLLLQLDSTSVPFYINFGDAGIGYAFVSDDGHVGKFLWQCA